MDIDKITETVAERTGHPAKKMFHIEKFLPPECPCCRAPFKREGEDWTRLLGDIVDGEKVIRQTAGYDIIVCSHCQNYTMRQQLETYTLASKERAEELVEKEGFVNLQTVTCVGSHTQDMHAVMGTPSGMRVLSMKCD